MRALEAAKFAPPALDAVLMRTRLIEALGEGAACARWLTAPSGAGKSTLVAAYAKASGKPVVWYSIDERDADPAFFFATFAREARARLAAADWPAFSDADREDERAFARRFFHAASAADTAAVLIFDDVHKAAGSNVAQWLAELVAVSAPPMEIVFISQAPPPAALFDEIAARRLTVCGDLDLRFSVEECAELAHLLRLADSRGDELTALTGGHAGALVLACELLRGAAASRAERAAVSEQIHRHLLGKLMGRLAPELRDALITASILPHPNAALLQALGHGADAAAAIEALAAHGLLIRHALDDGIIYEAHALVRRGALLIAREALGAEHVAQLQRRCARQLETASLLADALEVWLDVGDENEAVDVFERLAAELARSRQATRLRRAIERLPADRIAARPWLCFWAGHTLLGVDEAEARKWFACSYAAFEPTGDRTGLSLAAASVLIVFDAAGERLTELGGWLGRFRVLRETTPLDSPLLQRGVYLLGLICEANLADADTLEQSKVHAALDEVVSLAEEPAHWPSADLQLEAARKVVEHEYAFGTKEKALHYARATERLAVDHDASPTLRARWWLSVARLKLGAADYAGAERAAEESASLIERNGVSKLVVALGLFKIETALRVGAFERAADLLNELEPRSARASAADLAELARVGVRVLLLNGRTQEALTRGVASLEAARRAGYEGGQMVLAELDYAYALAANGRAGEGAVRLSRLVPLLGPGTRDGVLGVIRCLDFVASDGTDLGALSAGLTHARTADFMNLLRYVPSITATLCETALANDIEPEFARRLIEVQRLEPPPTAGPEWPWAVRVRSLGAFQLELAGVPYRPAHKAQDKPLELLKLLLAMQATGRTAPDKTWLAEQLWPDADDGNARKSLDMAVTRLRRLLGSDECVEAVEGKLQLSPRRVWTDLRPFSAALSRIQAQRDALARGQPASQLPAAMSDLLAAYSGEFLHGEEEVPWLLGARTHLSRAFRAGLLEGEAGLIDRRDSHFSLMLERALMVEPMAEDLTRALMRAYLARGEYAEAMGVYRRCRDMLSIVLGVKPGSATEEIREQVQRAAHLGGTAHSASEATLKVRGPAPAR